jgi:hypothetical protein
MEVAEQLGYGWKGNEANQQIMKQLILLLFRNTLEEFSHKTKPGDELVLTGVITTPLGKLNGIKQSQLEIMQIPYISENGKVGQVPMKKLYLDQVLDKLANDLGEDKSMLMDSSREIVIVANMDISSDYECCPCYYGSTQNPVNMANLQRLDANVMRCVNEGLEYLPSDLLFKWTNVVLKPIFEQARTVITGNGMEQSKPN